MRHLLLLPLLLLAACKEKKAIVPFTVDNAIAVATPEAAYVNEHLQFKVEGLPQTWKLLGQEEMNSILPDAVAGGARVNGTFSAIIVEPMGEATTEDYSTLIASNLTIALGIDEITEFEEITFAGQDARTFNTDAYVEGVPFHYRFITFIYKGFGYQLVSWHTKTPGKTKDPGLAEFTDCFSLLPGQPTLPPVEALPDNVAQAGRLKDGRFESGVFKFALSPTRNWRVMAGPSLQNMSAEARAGMEAPHQGLYISIETRQQGDHDPVALHDQLAGYIAASLEDPETARPAESLVLQIDGEPTTFLSFIVPGGIESRFYNAIVCRQGIVYDIEAWHLSDCEDAPALFQEAFDALEFLDPAQAAKIKDEIAATARIAYGVGPGFSFRNGTYRNFDVNCLWRQPHELWQVFTGDNAIGMNPDCSLWAVDLKANLSLQLVSEEAGDFTPDSFHELIMDFMAEGEIDPEIASLPALDLDGVPAQVSRITFGAGLEAFTYHVATIVHGGYAHQIHIWSQPDLAKKHQASIDSALKAFRFPSPALQEVTSDATYYQDNRLGWRLDLPGSAWTAKKQPHPLSAIGSVVQFSKGKNFMQVLGINIDPGADTERIINRMVSDSLKVNLDRSSGKGANFTSRTFAGHNAKVIEAKTDGVHMRVATFTDAGVLWMLMAGSNSEAQANTVFTNIESGFKVLP